MRKFLILAALGTGMALAAPAVASEALPQAMAHGLDGQRAEFTMTAAKQRRLMIIHETQRQQRYGYRHGYGRRGYGYGRPHGYGPRYGYGPRHDYYDRRW